MNNEQDILTGPLAQAVQQLNDTPEANKLPVDLDSAVLRAWLDELKLHENSPLSASGRENGRRSMILFAKKYSLAASIIIGITVAIAFGFLNSANSLYAAFTERLENLRSVEYRAQFVEESELGNIVAENGEKVTYLAPSHYRVEKPIGWISVFDTKAEKAIGFNPEEKTAIVMQGQLASTLSTLVSRPVFLLETLQKHFRRDRKISDAVESLGKKKIGEIHSEGFRSTISGETMEVWVDTAKSLPVEVRISVVIPSHVSVAGKSTQMWQVMSAFKYDVAVDPSLMSVEIPAGYAMFQMPELPKLKSVAAPSLTDLVDLLRITAKYNDSTFPDSLSTNDTQGSPMAIMKRFTKSKEQVWKSGTDAEKKTLMSSTMEFPMALGRVTPFLYSLRPENKFHYVGAGVKLNAPERPILWLSPKGDTQFKVVYADLSIKDVTESAILKIEKLINPKVETRQIIRSTSPRVTLPRSAIRDYDALQLIRKTGKQADVKFISLWLMRPLMENGPQGDPNVDITTSRFRFLQEFQNLEGLTADYLLLSGKDLEAIGLCRGLKKLSLSGIQIVEPSGEKHRLTKKELQYLDQLTNLEMLDLSQSNFSGGLQHLGKLPKLETLVLSSFENLNDASIAELKELPHLATLVLAADYLNGAPKKAVTDVGLASLKEIPNLRTLYIEPRKFTLPVEKLKSLLPGVDVQLGFTEGTLTVPSRTTPLPTKQLANP